MEQDRSSLISFIIAAFVFILMAVAVSSYAIVKNVTTTETEEFTGDAVFDNLTVGGSVTVDNGVSLVGTVAVTGDSNFDILNAASFQVAASSLSIGSTALDTNTIAFMKNQTQWCNIFLIPGQTLESSTVLTPSSILYVSFPFGNVMSVLNVESEGTNLDVFTISKSPLTTACAFARITNPSIWAISGSITLDYGDLTSPTISTPTTMYLILFVCDDSINIEPFENRQVIYQSFVTLNSSLVTYQTFNIPPCAMTFPSKVLSTENVLVPALNVGISLEFHYTGITTTVFSKIVVRNMNFLFKQIADLSVSDSL